MGSSYKEVDLFGSGPHRMIEVRRARRVISLSAIAGDASVAGTSEFGDYELRVEVRGRLVAGTDVGLWVIRDAIVGETSSEEESGVLVDVHGHSWSGVKLLSFEPTGEVQHGRVVSLGYTVVFGKLASG